MKTAALGFALFLLAPAALAGSRTLLSVANGAGPFAGDRPDLTTISPNGDGYRDAAHISFSEAGPARVEVDRADHKGPVLRADGMSATGLTWAPPAAQPPGTYVVRVSSRTGGTARAVVRVQSVDAAAGAADYAPGGVAKIAVATDARRLRVDVLHMDASSIATKDNNSVSGTVVEQLPSVAWSHRNRPHDLEVPIGNWQSGVYFARVTAGDGRVGYAPFVVRPAHLGTNRVAVVLPTYTWQAYNFYDRDGDGVGDTWYAGWHTHITRLGRPFLNNGVPSHFRRYDLRFLIWAARHQLHADYLSDVDLQNVRSGTQLARRYDLVVFPGHHEYVTQHEYDVVRGYRDRGGNLAWLSANNFFWKVVRHGPLLERVAQWRTLGHPEASLIGVQYRGNDEGERRGAMRPVPGAAPWLFAGTPLADGEPWGNFGIEIDHTAPSSPPGTTVVASIPDLYGPGFTAQMTYYETRAGAKVFAAGAFSLSDTATGTVGARLLDNLFDRLEQP